MVAEQTEEQYVLFEWSCACGPELQVHGEYKLGFRTGQDAVLCPECRKQYDLPTKALRLYVLEENAWQPAWQ
jgi:hypothetical protein